MDHKVDDSGQVVNSHSTKTPLNLININIKYSVVNEFHIIHFYLNQGKSWKVEILK